MVPIVPDALIALQSKLKKILNAWRSSVGIKSSASTQIPELRSRCSVPIIIDSRLHRTLSKVVRAVESAGEQLLYRVFQVLNLPAKPEYHYPCNTRRYDFGLNYQGTGVLIEWDGEQHFTESNGWFNQTLEEIQAIDREKLRMARAQNHRMIRIDYTWLKRSIQEVSECILQKLESSEAVSFSNPEMYRWLEPLGPKIKLRVTSSPTTPVLKIKLRVSSSPTTQGQC